MSLCDTRILALRTSIIVVGTVASTIVMINDNDAVHYYNSEY